MKLKTLVMLTISPLVLMACGTEEVELEPIPIPEEEEEIDMEQFRVSGDRVASEPVLSTEERKKRFIEQYETIDRPIIMNTLRIIRDYDLNHEGAFKGVRFISDRGNEELKEKKIGEYKEHLGGMIDPESVKVYDITDVYPYTEEDYSSYYETVIKIVQRAVMERTQTYSVVEGHIENRRFNVLRDSGAVRGFRNAIDIDGSIVEQVRPYIREMDNLIVGIRESLGMERPKYTTLDSEYEEVAEYKVPQKATVQEIISIDPTSDLYEDYSEDIEEEETAEEQEETEDVDNTEE